ncbi:hypothetical protein SAMN05216522_101182 [Rosenbergiella nectarea]|uniref:DUF5375 family protein n=1 Tax=Rosenbergiella nectarea TaxID=988801 RepID=A0A1H9D8R2_9GAMM|nr:DUF5375 family protein [Rosenbergiella nectarea]SEQ09717.1 hypothetical protein SAMN05216522_101182 [Rosenbergiella nectarea]
MKAQSPNTALQLALTRRAVACAWLTVCHEQQRYLRLTLVRLESYIEMELENFYLRQYGVEQGQEIACAFLNDLLVTTPVNATPCLSFLGNVVMDELSSRINPAPVTVH